jgi:hypothetical protein
VPRAIVFVPLVDTFLVVGYMLAFAIETSEFVGAFHPIIHLFLDFATTSRVVIVIFDSVPRSASCTFDMI